MEEKSGNDRKVWTFRKKFWILSWKPADLREQTNKQKHFSGLFLREEEQTH